MKEILATGKKLPLPKANLPIGQAMVVKSKTPSNLATAIPSISPQAGLGMADKSSISSPMEKREIPSTLN